jgi:serine/threonine-protein kinase
MGPPSPEAEDPQETSPPLDQHSQPDLPPTSAGEGPLATRTQPAGAERMPPAALPPRLGRYEVVAQIGQGGMGVVLRVRDPAFERDLALKALRPDQGMTPSLAQRFRDEAQIMGQLQHPGVPPVHDLGALPDGRPFFTMKLIRGRTLADILRESPDRALAVFEAVCQTVAYAHSRGIIHRDLKPSNVMVGAFGEVQVMDWGLAKALSGPGPSGTEDALAPPTGAARTEQTQAGAILGTPAYMAPEQARGEVHEVDERTDVFGLGAILCAILTGTPPFADSASENVYRKAMGADLGDAFARLNGCGADAELITLARACLAPRKEDRPRDAGAVSATLAGYQAGVRDRLRRVELERAAAEARAEEEKQTRQVAQTKAAVERRARRLALALAAAVVMLVAAGSGAALWYQQEQVRITKQKAEEEAERATQELERDRRAARSAAAIDLARQEAMLLREQALQSTDNPPRWQALLASASSALARADPLLAQEEGRLPASLLRQVGQLREQLDADEKDRKLVESFELILLDKGELDPVRGRFKMRQVFVDLRALLVRQGLVPGDIDPARAAKLIRDRPRQVKPRLVAILDECLLLAPPEPKRERQWFRDVLGAVDDDPWRCQARAALAAGDADALARLAGDAGADSQPASLLVAVAARLTGPAESGAIPLLRRAQQRFPQDFWVNHELAWYLHKEVFDRALRRAPTPAEMRRLDEAIRYFTVVVALRPKNPAAHGHLGNALLARGEPDAALAAYRKVLSLDGVPPRALATAHVNMGNVLHARNDPAGARRHYDKALEIDDGFATAHTNLGRLLQGQGELDAAVKQYRRAIQCNPSEATALSNLGTILLARKDITGALEVLRKAVDLEPRDPSFLTNLGNALAANGELDAAVDVYLDAVESDGRYTLGYYNLGLTLARKGDLDDARGAFDKAIFVEERFALAHSARGEVLMLQGHFGAARQATERGLALMPENDPNRDATLAQLRECERLLALEEKLNAVRSGQQKPKDAREQLALAELCQRYKKLHLSASRFYAAAFAAEPGLADDPAQQHRYQAACAAALAASGRGEDAGDLDDRQRAVLRKQALGWLRDELTALGKRGENAPAPGRAAVVRTLRRWQKAPELAVVRDGDALSRLPAQEREAWQRLWKDVEGTLASLGTRGPG